MLKTVPPAVWNCPITVAWPVAGSMVTRLLTNDGLLSPVAPNRVPATVVDGCCARPVIESGWPVVVTAGPMAVDAPVAGSVRKNVPGARDPVAEKKSFGACPPAQLALPPALATLGLSGPELSTTTPAMISTATSAVTVVRRITVWAPRSPRMSGPPIRCSRRPQRLLHDDEPRRGIDRGRRPAYMVRSPPTRWRGPCRLDEAAPT